MEGGTVKEARRGTPIKRSKIEAESVIAREGGQSSFVEKRPEDFLPKDSAESELRCRISSPQTFSPSAGLDPPLSAWPKLVPGKVTLKPLPH